MNTVKKSGFTFGRLFRWLAISVGVCLVPIFTLAVVAASCLRIDGDSNVLKKQVMAATGEAWETKVQMRAGRAVIGSVGAGLRFIDECGIPEARIVMKAVNSASVGVYERASERLSWSRHDLFAQTDKAMTRRGWTRVVGVADGDDTVMIYTKPAASDDILDVCLAVLDRNDLVVVSASVDTDALSELVEMHAPKEMRAHLKVASWGF